MDARFAAAARHSRLVRTLRVAVPAAVAVAMAAIIAVSVFNPFRLLAKLPIDPGRLVVSGTKVTMESPHLSGFTPDGRPYELWAKAATQDLTRPDQVDLSTLRAKLLTEDQSTVMIDARNGVFDTKSQLLQLRKDVYLLATSGYEAWLTQALVDLGKGTISSDEPVDVKWQGGTLRGQKLRITERGDLVRFDGGVVMHLDNAGPASPTTTPANSSAK
ncbi:MAG: LPS export ABC transporter periplasmic protein LptC [Rhodopseudomonas palustris]|nr:MAG: LPS export ABC transporter periplasmic protein LptC [Rhodopseudomonas palustris]